jgi:hypothetical protein
MTIAALIKTSTKGELKLEGSLINDILLINGSSELKNLKINEEE